MQGLIIKNIQKTSDYLLYYATQSDSSVTIAKIKLFYVPVIQFLQYALAINNNYVVLMKFSEHVSLYIMQVWSWFESIVAAT